MTIKANPYLFNLALLLFALVISVAAGAVFIPVQAIGEIIWARLFYSGGATDWPESFTTILLMVRLPHTLLIALTGAALAGSGAAYQGVFRNPLADPYLIGVASGAGLGAVSAMAIHWPEEIAGLYAIPMAAFCGAMLAVLIVYAIARVGKTLPVTTLILAGVAISSFATSLSSFLMFHSTHEIRRAIGWLLGGAMMSGWKPVMASFPYILLGLTGLSLSGHALNVLQFGEEQAQQLGLPAERAKTIIILAASLTTAAAVAFAGIVGFVGLIVPHICRLVWGTDYKRLIPLSILGGATMLLFADLISRVLLAPQVIPLGIVTALAGAPFFLWVLQRMKKVGVI